MHLGDAEFGTDLGLRQIRVVPEQQDPLLALGQLDQQMTYEIAVLDPVGCGTSPVPKYAIAW